jgi:peptidoglycan hydrolase CwlO-like protein
MVLWTKIIYGEGRKMNESKWPTGWTKAIVISNIVFAGIMFGAGYGVAHSRLSTELGQYRQLYSDATERTGELETELSGIQFKIDTAVASAEYAASGVTNETARIRENLKALQGLLDSMRGISSGISSGDNR